MPDVLCRLYGFRSNEPTKVECTLVHAQNAMMIQSRADRRGLSHTDGWGIAFYTDGFPTIERRDTAAYEDLHFASTAERVHAFTVVAHVRRATVGGAALDNTHPFQHGHWVFAHNGTLVGFDRLGPELAEETAPHLQEKRKGSTDSEQAFLWLLTRLAQAGHPLDGEDADIDGVLSVFRESVKEVASRCNALAGDKTERVNFLLTNGRFLMASRWNHTLHHVERVGIHDCEICGIPHVDHAPDHRYRAVVVASEPISHETWEEVPQRHVIVVDEGAKARVLPL